ncbi:MAG TPA: hypothetical protein VFH73_21105 [Polyangia bacterium]|nr:hypothetical protein [Polyangia bacterium]
MRRKRERANTVTLGTAIAACVAMACGIGIRRDLSSIPPGQIGFDDMCGLQEYFDTLEVKAAEPPRLVSSVDLESDAKKSLRGGKALYAFETEFQLKHLRRILDNNWKRLPEEIAKAKRIDLEVYWGEKAGVKRVVTETDFELLIDKQSNMLPYQVCISELIYGEPLYRQRRVMWGLPLPKPPAPAQAGAPADGGSTAPKIWKEDAGASSASN